MIKIALLTIAALYADGSLGTLAVPFADMVACEAGKTEFLSAVQDPDSGNGEQYVAQCAEAEYAPRVSE